MESGFFTKEEKRGEKKGRERKGDEEQQEELTTHWDITGIVTFFGVCCVAPRTIDIAVRVSAVLKRDRRLRGGSLGWRGIQM